MTPRSAVPQPLLDDLAALAGLADANAVWPEPSWQLLRRSGALGWAIPAEQGGAGLEQAERLTGYAALAEACLTTCFILSQRDAACRRLRDGENEALCRELLPSLARGEHFATVGLSQLTTSRQHTQPSLSGRLTAAALELTGTIPWVTGASRAQHVVIGAVLEDGRQVLAMLPMDLPGVSVGPPLDLMALAGSVTAEVRCENVTVDRKWLLAGPAERVLQAGKGGTGGLETSCLALGLASAALTQLEHEAVPRPQLADDAGRLRVTHATLWRELLDLAGGSGTPERTLDLRARANTLVLAATQSTLTASKGTGFVRSHPAQRWARQALFFLVWSCPWPAAAATLAHLTAALGGAECF
jgi:alkylation response protein AidB-like acyl-CoA dehydrogenase